MKIKVLITNSDLSVWVWRGTCDCQDVVEVNEFSIEPCIASGKTAKAAGLQNKGVQIQIWLCIH